MRVSFRLRRFREQAKTNLLSEQGKRLRIQRNVEVESVFGHIKHNTTFPQVQLEGVGESQNRVGFGVYRP